jgi:hypothetical protein
VSAPHFGLAALGGRASRPSPHEMWRLPADSRFLRVWFFRPFGALCFSASGPTACAVGCILSPFRGLSPIDAALLRRSSTVLLSSTTALGIVRLLLPPP